MKGLIVGLANDQSLAWGCATGPKAAAFLLSDRARHMDAGYSVRG